MIGALFFKAIHDARLLLISLMALLFGFMWLFVWISSTIEISAFLPVMQMAMPGFFEALLGISFKAITTRLGSISMAYVDPVVMFAAVTWSLSRGSDAVSGELNRGTMEMLLAQPTPRSRLLLVQAAVTTIGSALLCVSAWLGTCAGLATVPLGEEIDPMIFLPGVLNVFALMFFLAGATTLVSSMDRYRWRTIGIMGSVYVIALVIKVVARTAQGFDWLAYFTFLGAFDPHRVILSPTSPWRMSIEYAVVLIGLGIASYAVAIVVFCRRDLPAPL